MATLAILTLPFYCVQKTYLLVLSDMRRSELEDHYEKHVGSVFIVDMWFVANVDRCELTLDKVFGESPSFQVNDCTLKVRLLQGYEVEFLKECCERILKGFADPLPEATTSPNDLVYSKELCEEHPYLELMEGLVVPRLKDEDPIEELEEYLYETDSDQEEIVHTRFEEEMQRIEALYDSEEEEEESDETVESFSKLFNSLMEGKSELRMGNDVLDVRPFLEQDFTKTGVPDTIIRSSRHPQSPERSEEKKEEHVVVAAEEEQEKTQKFFETMMRFSQKEEEEEENGNDFGSSFSSDFDTDSDSEEEEGSIPFGLGTLEAPLGLVSSVNVNASSNATETLE